MPVWARSNERGGNLDMRAKTALLSVNSDGNARVRVRLANAGLHQAPAAVADSAETAHVVPRKMRTRTPHLPVQRFFKALNITRRPLDLRLVLGYTFALTPS